MSQVSAMGTLALAVADDAARGITDLFRSMPMTRLAVPFGRTLADLATPHGHVHVAARYRGLESRQRAGVRAARPLGNPRGRHHFRAVAAAVPGHRGPAPAARW